MDQSAAIGTTLAEILGCVLGGTDRLSKELLECPVDGLVALREVGVDEADGKPKVRLYIYDYLKRVGFKDDIKVRPNVFLSRSEVARQLIRLQYDRYYVVCGKEIFEVDGPLFKALIQSIVVSFVDIDTTDYFYT